MLSYGFFWDLALILLSTKLFGLLTRKFEMPQVVGALLAGLLLGPTCFNLLQETEFIDQMAEIGVILLMFMAGMETDVEELKNSGKSSLIIAALGVAVPLIGGFFVAGAFSGTLSGASQLELLQNIFIGVVLTATSVSITVETLREMGKLKTKSGTAILGAAVIDDILGIIILTVIISFKDPSVNIVSVLVRILLFFVFALGSAFVFYKFFNYMTRKHGKKRRIPIYSFILCLLLAFVAEHFFGIADITGAYLAGIIISSVTHNDYVAEKVEVMSYMIFSPIFFASIGIKTSLEAVNMHVVIFSLALLVVALLSKVVGCGLGGRITGFTKQESLRIGVGMISRGEVALIVADKGAAVGLIKEADFAPIIIVVLITTLITPILLKLVYKDKNGQTGSKDKEEKVVNIA